MSREFRLGIFVVGTLSILAFGVFWIGRNESLFSSTYRIKADFQNVAGLDNGAQVRVGGIHEGTVRRIELPQRPGGRITVVMDVKEATRSVLKTDSRASIKAEGLVGDKYVEISFGSENGARLKDGDRIESDPPLDVSDLIKKTNQILDATQTTMKDVGDTANNLSQVTSKINQGTGTIGGLVNDKTVYRQVAAGATSFQEDMEALKHNFLLRGFFKKRGYEDSSELAKYQINRLPAGPYLRKFTYDAREIFDKPDTAKLKDPKLFADAGKYMEEQTFSLAVVEASAGAKGDSDKEKVLSEARAMVVRDYFASNFRLDDTKLRTIALGKDSANSYMLEVVVYPPATKRWPVTQRTLAK